MDFGRKDKDMERKEERQYKIPMEMTAEVAADFGISRKELTPMKIGNRRTRGIFVPVTKEVYDAYMRPLWREAKREERHETPFSLEWGRDEYAWEIPADMDVAEEVEKKESVAAVRKALADLSEKDREILSLVADGRPVSEIAKRMGMSERGVRYRKSAALLRMKDFLANVSA